MRFFVKSVGLAALLVAACQGPDEYFHGPFDAGSGAGGVVGTGTGGTANGTAGSGPGAGGIPTGLGGTGPGAAGTTGAAGAIGSGGASPTGTAGSGATTGAAGTTSGRGGTTGSAGTNGTGRGGTTGTAGAGAAGTTGTGRGGTTGAAGSATTGTAGTTGAGGTSSSRGGTTGTAGTTGTGGGTATVLYSDDFENETVGATSANGWSRTGGSSGDWAIATDGTKVLEQSGSNSSTVRAQSVTGASGSPWSGAVTASARVKMIAAGSSNQAALLCVRFNAISDRYCGALVPGGVQILTAVGGTAGGSAVFSASVTTGTFYNLRISVDASNVLTVFLDGTQKGTYTPAAMANGTVAVGTASMEAAFDDLSVTRP